MDASKYNREIRLLCPTCGGTQFECDETTDSDEQTVKCVQCNRETTKRALIDENSESINAHISEIGDEVVKDIGAELSKTLKKIFK
jgi:hypothetical protein